MRKDLLIFYVFLFGLRRSSLSHNQLPLRGREHLVQFVNSNQSSQEVQFVKPIQSDDTVAYVRHKAVQMPHQITPLPGLHAKSKRPSQITHKPVTSKVSKASKVQFVKQKPGKSIHGASERQITTKIPPKGKSIRIIPPDVGQTRQVDQSATPLSVSQKARHRRPKIGVQFANTKVPEQGFQKTTPRPPVTTKLRYSNEKPSYGFQYAKIPGHLSKLVVTKRPELRVQTADLRSPDDNTKKPEQNIQLATPVINNQSSETIKSKLNIQKAKPKRPVKDFWLTAFTKVPHVQHKSKQPEEYFSLFTIKYQPTTTEHTNQSFRQAKIRKPTQALKGVTTYQAVKTQRPERGFQYVRTRRPDRISQHTQTKRLNKDAQKSNEVPRNTETKSLHITIYTKTERPDKASSQNEMFKSSIIPYQVTLQAKTIKLHKSTRKPVIQTVNEISSPFSWITKSNVRIRRTRRPRPGINYVKTNAPIDVDSHQSIYVRSRQQDNVIENDKIFVKPNVEDSKLVPEPSRRRTERPPAVRQTEHYVQFIKPEQTTSFHYVQIKQPDQKLLFVPSQSYANFVPNFGQTTHNRRRRPPQTTPIPTRSTEVVIGSETAIDITVTPGTRIHVNKNNSRIYSLRKNGTRNSIFIRHFENTTQFTELYDTTITVLPLTQNPNMEESSVTSLQNTTTRQDFRRMLGLYDDYEEYIRKGLPLIVSPHGRTFWDGIPEWWWQSYFDERDKYPEREQFTTPEPLCRYCTIMEQLFVIPRYLTSKETRGDRFI